MEDATNECSDVQQIEHSARTARIEHGEYEHVDVDHGAEERISTRFPANDVAARLTHELTEAPQKRPHQGTKQSARVASVEHAGPENTGRGEDAEDNISTSQPVRVMAQVATDSKEAPSKRPREAIERRVRQKADNHAVGRRKVERCACVTGRERLMTRHMSCARRYNGGYIRTLDLLSATPTSRIVAVGDFYPNR